MKVKSLDELGICLCEDDSCEGQRVFCKFVKDTLCVHHCLGVQELMKQLQGLLSDGMVTTEELKKCDLSHAVNYLSKGLGELLLALGKRDWSVNVCAVCDPQSIGIDRPRMLKDMTTEELRELANERTKVKFTVRGLLAPTMVKGKERPEMLMRVGLNTEDGVLRWIDEWQPFKSLTVMDNETDTDVTTDFWLG